METTLQPARPGWEHRLQAVLALISGEPIPQVTARFGMGRSILYKWRHRALTALQGALTDHHHGPQCPANRLSPAQEHPLVELPTLLEQPFTLFHCAEAQSVRFVEVS